MTAPTTLRPTTGTRRGVRIRMSAATKRYGSVTALDEVDLDVEPSRFCVLLGPSGSGKSTLIRLLAGIERLDGGLIAYDDELVSTERRHVPPERRNLAMVFQDYALWPHLTAAGNVAYALRRQAPDRTEARSRVAEALDRVRLLHLADRYPHELSGGEQQRVALARAVVGRPRLLLFDEPLSNLDSDLRELLRVEIATITRETGATAIYITHDQSEAFALADDVGVLRAGRLEQWGTPEQVYREPATPFVARFTGTAGELPGQVVQRGPGHVLVRTPYGALSARGDIDPGSSVTVHVRPSATSLHPAHDDRPQTLAATVIDIAYRARGYDHVLDVAGARLTGVFDARPWSRGTDCRVALDGDGCLAFPHDPADSVPSRI